MIECSVWDVECFSRIGIDEDTCFIQCSAIVDQIDGKELVGCIWIKTFIPEDTFHGEGSLAIDRGLDPIGVSLDRCLINKKQLITTLFSFLEPDLSALLIENEVCQAIDNLVVVILESDLLNHEELSEIVWIDSN